jgi:Inner membrane protein YgaP-like, transmembrane domain
MSRERWVRLVGGTFILVSLALSRLYSEYWLLFTAFVGVNLFQSALTGWCLMDDILRAAGVGAQAPGAPSPTTGTG